MSGIFRSIRRGADRAAFEAERLVRVQREQSKLSNLSAEKRDRLVEIGERVWELFQAQQVTDARLLALCGQVQGLNTQIADQERTVERIKEEQPPEPPKCSACGRELAPSDTFCPACGARVTATSAPAGAAPAGASSASQAVIDVQPSPPAAATPAARACPKCGRSLRAGATFCGGCGTRLA